MPETEDKQKRSPRYTVEMSGSNWSVALYGAVEFLRSHPFLRPLVASLGVLLGLTLLGVFGGPKINGFAGGFCLVIVLPTIFWVAVVSGPRFELVFRESKAFDERQSAEKQFEASRTPEDALHLDFARLNEYYVINQSQARSSFRWAIFFMFLGSGTIVAGIWLFYFKTNQPDKFMASLSTGAGLIVSLCSSLFLSLYSKTQGRSLHYYEQLSQLQRISIAIRLADEHKELDKQAESRNLVIRCLLSEKRELPPSAANE